LLEVKGVEPEGMAAALGIVPGDGVMAVDGREIRDVIDYRFFIAEEQVALTIKKLNRAVVTLNISKAFEDDLGLEFGPLRIRRCRNNCIFCFVDQMPSGCRKSLYVKDDDYRASFLYGNYITLGNISEEERARIFEQRLSPLYVSVHATEPDLRRFMLGNRRAPDIRMELERLAAGGIRFHTQIVLCPGINDGSHLTRTVNDLAGLFPSVASIAVVPVGITSHRQDLYPVAVFSKRRAQAAVREIESLARRFKRTLGTNLVFASDELYIRSGERFPSYRSYEDFPQIENGVGMVAAFLHEAERMKLPRKIHPLKITLVTGRSFGPILKRAVNVFRTVRGLTMNVVTAVNRFFGPTVTVSGLLSGQDIVTALENRKIGDILVLPAAAIKEGEELFLDGMTSGDMARILGTEVRIADSLHDIAQIVREGIGASV
jgi:putative radical SAM enzyme (TIGR03279 family)